MTTTIRISDNIEIEEDSIETRAIHSSGPGGQHVNKTMTAIQLRFDIMRAYTLPYEVQQRLIGLAGRRVNSDLQLVITARRHRSQERNRRAAFERLFELVRKAALSRLAPGAAQREKEAQRGEAAEALFPLDSLEQG